MKKIIIAALFFSTAAHAEQWLEMPNQAGGKIILTKLDCDASKKGKLVIATTPDGDNARGCWYFFAEMVHVVWDSGKTSSFEPRAFTVKESK